MKKLIILLLIFLTGFFVFAQDIDFEDLEDTFNGFAEDMAPTIPTLANVGLQWSDAWLGYFPHFGIGATIGSAFVPIGTFEDVLDGMGQDTGVLSDLPSIGIPLTAIAGEGRIGGFILPFDIGIKFGMIPGSVSDLAGDVIESLEYQMVGFDVRYALVKENLVLPNISVGIGYTNLQTNVVIPLGDDQNVGSWDVPTGAVDGEGNPVTVPYSLVFADPSAEFGWTSNIIDFKAQISKSFLVLTPYIGAGVSIGISNVGGGIKTEPVIEDNLGNTVDIDTVEQMFETAGLGDEFPDLSTTGISFYGDHTGPSFRVYGGTSINLLIFRTDISATLNPVTMALGGQINFRLQL